MQNNRWRCPNDIYWKNTKKEPTPLADEVRQKNTLIR